MSTIHPVNAYVRELQTAGWMKGQVVYHHVFEATAPVFGRVRKPWPAAIDQLLVRMKIDRLYAHQVRVMDRIREGLHTVAATPTASGKTLTFALPTIEAVVADRSACALYVYPLKALAQDQLRSLTHMAAQLTDISLRCAVYDGDTSAYRRKKIRDNPPHILMTNPEMIHLSICPHHDRWADLLARLQFVVIDEMHSYRGILGAHMAQVLRRLIRMCRHYGADPTFVFTSATVADPEALAGQLTGLSVASVQESGAGSGQRHLMVVDPHDGTLGGSLSLLHAALTHGLRTIVYTQSRKLAELLAIWSKQRAGPLADRISAYRAGFLPEERRRIEAKLSSGELLAVVTTSALELGIDIGRLDLCLLVGYPGSIMATRQRGGRVGRSGQESAVVLVGGDDALDQFFIRHPEQLVQRGPEAAVVNAFNPEVLARHLVCAAAELPLDGNDALASDPAVHAVLQRLVAEGALHQSADGRTFFSPLKNPHRQVDLRGSGARYAIVVASHQTLLGDIDGLRVFREAHPGAIYLHRGQTHRVVALEPEMRRVTVSPCRVDYHTRVRSRKTTEILSIIDRQPVYGTVLALGRLRVTEQVTGYERVRTRTGSVLERIPLDLPPTVFDTDGVWLTLPQSVIQRAQADRIHVMGGLHALEHAAIGVFPLMVLADRNDLGGIATPVHPQLKGAAIFIYDGLPGGSGLCAQVFADGPALLEHTLAAITGCPCESGCPSCVHSPKCGSGNRPIDKAAAVVLLQTLMARRLPPARLDASCPAAPAQPSIGPPSAAGGRKDPIDRHYGVLDIETQLSAEEVGGWHRAHRMRVSCAVLYDSAADTYFEYVEGQMPALLDRLQGLPLVIGFNIKRFDYRVLSAYTETDLWQLATLDILEAVKNRLGYRLSLDHLASATLQTGKTADGLDALRWWREGQMGNILAYCRSDVTITRDLYRFGRRHRYLLFRNKAKQTVRLPVDW